jgi:hypothetical protein
MREGSPTRTAGFTALLIALALASLLRAPGVAEERAPAAVSKHSHREAKLGAAPAVLWTDPTDLESRDLYYGCGGKDHQPRGKLKFVKENLSGINPKFDVRDAEGVRWGVKLGAEAGPETAASRLVWAVGYFTNEDYYVPELRVSLPSLSRGEEFIKGNKIRGVRLKRHNKRERKIGYWSWNKNPFAETRELNGLKVMMELINNTDLKPEHLVIYDVGGREQHYFITDLGGSFGRAGAHFYNRTKGVLKDFDSFPLIQKAGPDYVDFWYFRHVPRADAKWIGGILARLSDNQIRDAFRAAGFSAEEVEGFTRKVRAKINELTSL